MSTNNRHYEAKPLSSCFHGHPLHCHCFVYNTTVAQFPHEPSPPLPPRSLILSYLHAILRLEKVYTNFIASGAIYKKIKKHQEGQKLSKFPKQTHLSSSPSWAVQHPANPAPPTIIITIINAPDDNTTPPTTTTTGTRNKEVTYPTDTKHIKDANGATKTEKPKRKKTAMQQSAKEIIEH